MTAAPQIAAGVHARWPDEQMVLSKADSGMSFATKWMLFGRVLTRMTCRL